MQMLLFIYLFVFIFFRCALTSAILMVSVPGDGGDEVDAGQSGHEALETVSLASFRAVRPVPI